MQIVNDIFKSQMKGLAKFFTVANYHRKSAITGAIDEAPWTDRLSVVFETGRQVDRQQDPPATWAPLQPAARPSHGPPGHLRPQAAGWLQGWAEEMGLHAPALSQPTALRLVSQSASHKGIQVWFRESSEGTMPPTLIVLPRRNVDVHVCI